MKTTILSAKQHIIAAMDCTEQAKNLEQHIAYLRGDAFGLRLKATQLREKAIWHMDFADAIKNNSTQYMYSL